MARLLGSLLILILPALAGAALAATSEAPLFASEAAAEQHCPTDLVVWVDPATRIYYYRGQNRYGSTKTGGYACRKDLIGHGYRPNRTGR
ncbi:MAG TPA: hypothetical protein VMA53_13375 [Stellaceae bacterium]|jgi:hypothetical protein|nr:hypothetical protein [Stellaceae bacterium]